MKWRAGTAADGELCHSLSGRTIAAGKETSGLFRTARLRRAKHRIRLDPGWLAEPHATAVIRTPIPDDPRPPGMFGSTDPDSAAMGLLADEPTRREALRWLLDLLAEEHDLRAEPGVPAVLAGLAGEWLTGDDLADQVRRLSVRLAREVDGGPGMSPERWQRYYRMRAGEAFAAALTAMRNGSFPTGTLWYAEQALRERWPAVRAELWRRARSHHR